MFHTGWYNLERSIQNFLKNSNPHIYLIPSLRGKVNRSLSFKQEILILFLIYRMEIF